MDALYVREKARSMAEVERKLSEVATRSSQNEGAVKTLEGAAKDHADRLDVLHHQVERRVDVDDFKDVSDDVKRLAATVARKAERRDAERVEEVLAAWVRKAEKLEADAEGASKRSDLLEGEIHDLGGAALKKAEFNKYLSASGLSDYDATIRSIKLELDAKAWAKDFNALSRRFGQLSGDFVGVKDKARLAADFVDWYARKGEAFEGNLNAVDKHIKELVVEGRVIDS